MFEESSRFVHSCKLTSLVMWIGFNIFLMFISIVSGQAIETHSLLEAGDVCFLSVWHPLHQAVPPHLDFVQHAVSNGHESSSLKLLSTTTVFFFLQYLGCGKIRLRHKNVIFYQQPLVRTRDGHMYSWKNMFRWYVGWYICIVFVMISKTCMVWIWAVNNFLWL